MITAILNGYKRGLGTPEDLKYFLDNKNNESK
jgi:hypothetical protein